MQMADTNDPQPNEGLEAPPGLVSALKRLPRQPIFIPPTLDEAVLRAARGHLRKRQVPRLKWLRLMPWVAATTAAILLLAVMPHLLRKSADDQTGGFAPRREDLNHDGRVDILDAFSLARRVKSGEILNSQFDLNGDGVVDERDVAILAARVVRLGKGGRS